MGPYCLVLCDFLAYQSTLCCVLFVILIFICLSTVRLCFMLKNICFVSILVDSFFIDLMAAFSILKLGLSFIGSRIQSPGILLFPSTFK